MTQPHLDKSIFSLTNHEVFLISAQNNGKRSAFIATWCLPASLLPNTPRLMFLGSPLNYTMQLIEESKMFAVTLLAKDQADYLLKFGLESGKGLDKFAEIELEENKFNIPIVKNSCGWSICKLNEIHDIGERKIVLGEVLEQKCFSEKSVLKKKEAFASLDDNSVKLLKAKHKVLGEASRELWKEY